ncbi:MDIS1-interacting receptor like kinase 2-like [Cucurbita moschata]|uniref:MDIS1-interacting receptor like kinase 2-like n=1 Tax=Cucurbita moschata TaxID=3662 RepID=A0A6J1E2H7_CUCMO|nr:MDIS1-interacting receptor like kinase 2-like [Cucurbita moschata]
MVNIDLYQNYLVGSIPSEITMLKKLIGLNLSHDNLTGIIPAEIGEVESLESLDLSFNQLSGPIPRSISRLNSLGVLKLSHNNLSEEIPREGHLSTSNEASSFGNNPNLCGDPLPKKCTIENPFERSSTNMENQDEEEDKWEKWLLYIMIILGLVRKIKNLQSLSLSTSLIYGSIPTSLGNLSNFKDLDVSNNALIGANPTSFGRLLNLKKLYLGQNRLEELEEECFIQLENLETFVLEEAHFDNLSRLNSLLIADNEHLSLEMTSNWVPAFQLNHFDAGSCIGYFGSEFPPWLRTQKTLVNLWLSNTSISSAFPRWLRTQNLTTLDLSYNQIVGPIPTSIRAQMPNLENLYLNDNLINDSLPLSLCKLKNGARLFVLSSNLILLDLSSNNFSGKFPYSHGNLLGVQMLNLENNSEGSMPSVMKNARDLNFLNLGRNKFYETSLHG